MIPRFSPAVLLAALLVTPLVAQSTQEDEDGLRRLVRGTHDRMLFQKDIERVAVGDPALMSVDSISTRELLLLGLDTGRTSLIVWFDDGTIGSTQWVVQPDLRVLERALRDIDLSITARIAPDRDAIVLRGYVDDRALAVQAEAVTSDYLQVGRRDERRDPQAESSLESQGESFPDEGDSDTSETVGAKSKRTGGSRGSRTAVINLIRYPSPDFTPIEERIESAISAIAGAGVVVRRVMVGSAPNNTDDVFLLEGSVANQIALTRLLHLAGRVLSPSGDLRIEVLADESGGLAGVASSSQGGGGGGGGGSSLLSGSGSALQNLRNRIEANIGRATVLSAAGGRVLSFIEVREIPQVRIEVQFYEVNRTKLRSRGVDIKALGATFDENELLPGAIARDLQGPTNGLFGAAPVGNDQVHGAASWLDGALSGQVQLNVGRFAMDTVLQFLQSEGVARSLSRPNLVMLSGETAVFQVGGEVPILTAVGNNSLVGFGVTFREFGIQLAVRPLVGEDGRLTMDLSPEIVLPDAALTAQLTATTGSAQDTTAFSSRSLQTTARFRDGEMLILGGLISRTDNEDSSKIPGLSDIPLLGWAFDSESRNGDQVELMIVVNPVILHEERYETRLWDVPSQLVLAFDTLASR